MVWEQDVKLVVMVANLNERYRSQCAKYWPDDVSVSVTIYNDARLMMPESMVSLM